MRRVFISYAREDIDAAIDIFNSLESHGFEPWLDKKSLKPGERWERAIARAIRNSHYFIAVLSKKSVSKKGYVQKELRLAMEILDTIPEDQIYIIPARLDNCQPTHERLRELNWVDLFPDNIAGISAIERVIGFTPKEVFQTSLASTTWQMMKNGTKSDSKKMLYQIIFKPDGELLRRRNGRRIPTNGRWRQAGRVVYMEVNNNYAQYKGELSEDAAALSGSAQNIKGAGWKWVARRVFE